MRNKFCFAVICLFALLIFILARSGLFRFHSVSVQDAKQIFSYSRNKPKHNRSNFILRFILVRTETRKKCFAGYSTPSPCVKYRGKPTIFWPLFFFSKKKIHPQVTNLHREIFWHLAANAPTSLQSDFLSTQSQKLSRFPWRRKFPQVNILACCWKFPKKST